MIEFFGLLLIMVGFIVGLGAVTVIDLHGYLGRRSSYWTEATIRTHKVTKPLIWIGMALIIIGGFSFYSQNPITWIPILYMFIIPILIINGSFLSFYISPYLIKREQEGLSKELLPKRFQTYITISFIVSFITWWSLVILFAWYLFAV